MTITKKHRAYFNAARAVSNLSDFPRVNIGCVIVYGHKIISSGFNSMKSHPLQRKYNTYRFDVDGESAHTLHAETQALLPLIGRNDIDFSRVSLYTYRQCKNGCLANARPCTSCMALIRSLGIRHIYYTNEGSYVNENLLY